MGLSVDGPLSSGKPYLGVGLLDLSYCYVFCRAPPDHLQTESSAGVLSLVVFVVKSPRVKLYKSCSVV